MEFTVGTILEGKVKSITKFGAFISLPEGKTGLVHISEIRIGSGLLDYETFLTEMQAYPEVPLMLEHLDTQEDYRIAAENVRKVAAKLGFAMPQPE